MVNPRKVRAMSQKYLFESQEGSKALRIKKYCEDFPFWRGLARSALAGLLLCLMILLIVFVVFPDLLPWMRSHVGNIWTGVILALTLAVFAALYSILSDIIFRRIYARIRSSLCSYQSVQASLKKISHEQESL